MIAGAPAATHVRTRAWWGPRGKVDHGIARRASGGGGVPECGVIAGKARRASGGGGVAELGVLAGRVRRASGGGGAGELGVIAGIVRRANGGAFKCGAGDRAVELNRNSYGFMPYARVAPARRAEARFASDCVGSPTKSPTVTFDGSPRPIRDCCLPSSCYLNEAFSFLRVHTHILIEFGPGGALGLLLMAPLQLVL